MYGYRLHRVEQHLTHNSPSVSHRIKNNFADCLHRCSRLFTISTQRQRAVTKRANVSAIQLARRNRIKNEFESRKAKGQGRRWKKNFLIIIKLAFSVKRHTCAATKQPRPEIWRCKKSKERRDGTLMHSTCEWATRTVASAKCLACQFLSDTRCMRAMMARLHEMC